MFYIILLLTVRINLLHIFVSIGMRYPFHYPQTLPALWQSIHLTTCSTSTLPARVSAVEANRSQVCSPKSFRIHLLSKSLLARWSVGNRFTILSFSVNTRRFSSSVFINTSFEQISFTYFPPECIATLWNIPACDKLWTCKSAPETQKRHIGSVFFIKSLMCTNVIAIAVQNNCRKSNQAYFGWLI